jgi:hypothetical protein
MRATLLLCPLFIVAACAATTPKDLERMPIAEVCYLGMSDPDQKPMADAEVARRKANCQDHTAEIKKIEDIERRAGMGDAGTAQGGARPSGGMGRY